MKRRCPKARPIRQLILKNGILTFRGVADIEITDDPNDLVAGGLWWISKECEASLDCLEGANTSNTGFYLKKYFLVKYKGRQRDVMFYQMNPDRHRYDEKDGIMPPNHDYYQTLVDGYRDFRLPEDLLIDALHRSHGEKNKTPPLLRKWRMRGKQPLMPLPINWKRDEMTT
jgi:hypothetical protein